MPSLEIGQAAGAVSTACLLACLPACLLARLLAAEWAGIGSKRGQMERKVREDVGLFEGRCR